MPWQKEIGDNEHSRCIGHFRGAVRSPAVDEDRGMKWRRLMEAGGESETNAAGRGEAGIDIAGTVYDPRKKEVIIRATCTLIESDTGKVVKTETDDFGDFWFEGLMEGGYSLETRLDGKVKSFAGLDARGKDVNLGDIPFI